MQFATTLLLFRPDTDPEGEYTILSISRGDNLKDWGLVGGKVEKGESMEEALYREVQEEAGALLLDGLIPVYTGMARTRITTTFLATNAVLPKELPSTREGTVAWKKLSELLTEDCTYHDYNVRLFKHLGIW